MLAPFEASFAQALLDPKRPIPDGINPARRFSVYRNNVVAGLVKALASRFPAIERIVGEEFFAAMARAFVAACPPRSAVLASYGEGFADFIAAFEPACDLVYLADVARIEAARTRAYHAADATPMSAGEFAALDVNAIAGLRVTLHPSAEIVRSAYPIVTIWAMNSGEQALSPIDDWCGEDALVARPHLDVEVRLLPEGGAAFLLALAEQRALGEAADVALAECPEFDLTRNLAGLIGWGLVQNINAISGGPA